jgi:hypothetical protein
MNMSHDWNGIIKGALDEANRPMHKKFALDRLAKIETELRDAIDGGEECQGRDSWLSGLISDIEYVQARVRNIE